MTADDNPVPFEVDVRHLGAATVLSVRGEVDLTTAPQLKHAVDTVIAQSTQVALIVDLTEVPFFASSGMTLLIDAALRVADHTSFAVVADGPHTARPMMLLGLNTTFDIYLDLDTAVAAVLH